MVKAVIDTNILVDYLHGIPEARAELALYQRPAISAITWMELMVGTAPQAEPAVRAFLQTFDLLEIDASVAERAVQIRKSKRIRLPDAIIWATAQVHQGLLVTRNTRDFDAGDPGVRVPYVI
jgi:predicted nucleic acid-binding protein